MSVFLCVIENNNEIKFYSGFYCVGNDAHLLCLSQFFGEV